MKIFSSLRGVSALTLFVACITGTDDPDFAVTFDDLAEFASAFHRRSDFHFFSPEFELLVSCYLRYSIFCLLCRHDKRRATTLSRKTVFRKRIVTPYKLSLPLSAKALFLATGGGIDVPHGKTICLCYFS